MLVSLKWCPPTDQIILQCIAVGSYPTAMRQKIAQSALYIANFTYGTTKRSG